MLTRDFKFRVWYKDTDQMGIVHHSNYICYYEAARSEFLRALGMSFAEVERRGIMMPILEVQSKYRKPAYFDELLTVRIILREMPSTRINFFYEIYNERGDLLNTGMTQLGFIHSDSRRPCRCPEWFLELIRSRFGSDSCRFALRSGFFCAVTAFSSPGKSLPAVRFRNRSVGAEANRRSLLHPTFRTFGYSRSAMFK